MSLKTFHIMFVAVSTILAIGFGVWAIRDYGTSGEAASMVLGVLSLCGAVSMIVYGRWFLRKLKHISYL